MESYSTYPLLCLSAFSQYYVCKILKAFLKEISNISVSKILINVRCFLYHQFRKKTAIKRHAWNFSLEDACSAFFTVFPNRTHFCSCVPHNQYAYGGGEPDWSSCPSLSVFWGSWETLCSLLQECLQKWPRNSFWMLCVGVRLRLLRIPITRLEEEVSIKRKTVPRITRKQGYLQI